MNTESPAAAAARARGARLPLPPGPRTWSPLGSAIAYRRDPLGFLSRLTRQYGDVSSFRLLTLRICFVNHPLHLQRVLRDRWESYDKNVALFRTVSHVMGDGLATAIGDERWKRRRRLLQPIFHRQRLARLGSVMTEATRAMLDAWEAPARSGEAIDVADQMTQLSLRVLCRALFRMESTDEHYHRLNAAFAIASEQLNRFVSLPFPPLSWRRRLREQCRIMDAVVASVIQQRRQGAEHEAPEDLTTVLLRARDDETGDALTDRDVRDEVITFLLTGHETTALSLAWAWYEIARHPEVQERLQREVDTVLGGREPTVDDLPRLTYARMIFDETLRLYPPAWQLMRRANVDDEIGGYRVPMGTAVMWSPYVLHRHPAFWVDPERFDPERFGEPPSRGDGAPAGRRAYLPFGDGPRLCIGMHFAVMETLLVLAAVTQRYRLTPGPGLEVQPEPLLTLRPAGGVPVYVQRR